MNNVPLNALPLFRDVKENLIQQNNGAQRHQYQHQQHSFGPHHVNRRRNPIKRVSTIQRYMAPLSAYNASEERPYYPDGRFDEMAMRIEMEQKRLSNIRTLGYNYIRPIGIGHTLQMSTEKKRSSAKLRAEEVIRQEEQLDLQRHEQREQSGYYQELPVLPSDFQENRDRSSIYEYNREADRSGTSPPQAQQQPSQLVFPQPAFTLEENIDDEEEDEISYDYEAEFARVEDEQNVDDEQDGEDEEDEYLDRDQETHLKMMNPRSTMRDNLTIQQFVETSHMGGGHPYDIEDGYENPQLEVETNQGDSGDFTEVPWANISDAVQSMDSRRISSLNSLITRRMISSSTVTTNINGTRLVPSRSRRVSDNNSDQELN